MTFVSKFILIAVKGRTEVLEVKAVPLASNSIKAFINKGRHGKEEGWVITSEETGCCLNFKIYPTITAAQKDWPDVEKRCASLLEDKNVREGYDEKKKFFDVMVKEYQERLEFLKELIHA